MTEQRPVSMVRLRLDAARLARFSSSLRLPRRHEDVGFLVHTLLAALYGEATVQPFRPLDAAGRWLPVLGYTNRSKEELRTRAEEFADPADFEACCWEDFAVKPMPAAWALGRRVGFEVRVCPVVRLSSSTEVTDRDGSTSRFKSGSEIDAWVHRRFFRRSENDEVSCREAAYGDWLRQRIGNAAQIESVALTRFRRIRLVRRAHDETRKARVLERPDVTLKGTLTILDGSRFQNLLVSGIGRHKTFGFGMLLLRAP